jgi:hypothetical protein
VQAGGKLAQNAFQVYYLRQPERACGRVRGDDRSDSIPVPVEDQTVLL